MRQIAFTMSTEQDLFDWFTAAGCALSVQEHPATPTVAEAERIKLALPQGHSKSLLFKEKDGTLTLVTARGKARADLKGLARASGAKRFSFAPEAEMVAALGVRPGELTPLALINDRDRQIGRVILDAPLLDFAEIWCHPLRNTASVGLSPEALLAFIAAHHGEPLVLDVMSPDAKS